MVRREPPSTIRCGLTTPRGDLDDLLHDLLPMGADQFAHGIAVVAGRSWFVVRKQPKGRGTNRLVEGQRLGPGDRVLLVDDIVTTGGSIQKAYDHILETGANVVMATTLVDRGDVASKLLR